MNSLQLHHDPVGTLSQTKGERQPVCSHHSKTDVHGCRQEARAQALMTDSIAVWTSVSPVSWIVCPNPRLIPYPVGAQTDKPVVKIDFVTDPEMTTSGSAPVQQVPRTQLWEEWLSASPSKTRGSKAPPVNPSPL